MKVKRKTELIKGLGRSISGFTLVELIVVVVVIGILVAIAVPIYAQIQKRAVESVLLANTRIVLSQVSNLIINEEIPFKPVNPSNEREVLRDKIAENLASIANPVNKKAAIITSSQTAGVESAAIVIAYTSKTMKEFGINDIKSNFPFTSDSKNKFAGAIIVRICSDGYLLYSSNDGGPFYLLAYPSESFKIDINSANANELTLIIGIGPTLADRIIANRPFATLDQLTSISGIGPVTLSRIKEQGIAFID